MKVIIYNISQDTKKSLALLNRKSHTITIITDPLGDHTVRYANDKEVIISDEKNLSTAIRVRLISFGIKYIILRSVDQLEVQLINYDADGLKYSKIKGSDPESEAYQIITILDKWQVES